MEKKYFVIMGVITSLISFALLSFNQNGVASENEFYIEKVENMPKNFIKGVDISTLIAQEQSGVKYFDENGQEKDLIAIMNENGVNYVRIRVWNDPYNEQGQGYGAGNSDIAKAIVLGKRATDAGMKVLIDFHYSDFWADPGRQIPPKAWTGYTVDQKADALYEFTKTSLEQMIESGVNIGMVQVGNETTGSGIAGESGNGRYDLFRAGVKAIREVDPSIKIALHFTNPERTSMILNYAQELKNNEIDYDVFATSYYAFWHGSLDNLTYVLKTVADTYGKETMVAETSYAYTLEDGDGQPNVVRHNSQIETGGYPATVQGQANSLRDVMNATVKSGEKALGVFYWEPAWIPVGPPNRELNMPVWEKYGSGWASTAAIGYDTAVDESNYGGSEWDNQALFDFEGKALNSLKVFKYVAEGYGEKPTEKENLIINGSFEDSDMSAYRISQPYVNRKAEDPKSGTYSLHFYSTNPVNFNVEQEVQLQPGKYRFNLSIQGDGLGMEENAFSYAKIKEKMVQQTDSINLAGYLVWKTPSLEFTISEPTIVTLGVSVKGNAESWGTIDDWRLEQIDHTVDEISPENMILNLQEVNILKKGNLFPLAVGILSKDTSDKTII